MSSYTSLHSMPASTRKSYRPSGIGGAGNYHETSSAPITSSSTKFDLHVRAPRTTGVFHTGIGGSGNMRQFSERAHSISQEEELTRKELAKAMRPAHFHRGIGGAGNLVTVGASEQGTPRSSSEGRSSYSHSGSDSIRERLVGYLKI